MMKKIKYIISILFISLTVSLYAIPFVAVVDFDYSDYCTQQDALIMTDLFHNKLVQSNQTIVVDRENPFIGEWESSIENYRYNIVLMHSNICIITVKTIRNNREVVEDTYGTWSFDDNIIRISGVFLDSKTNDINWISVYQFTSDTSFNMLVLPASESKSMVRVSFSRISRGD
jgi:hypothetical protein